MPHRIVRMPPEVARRAQRLAAAPFRFDLLFEAEETPVGVWTDTLSPTEDRQLLVDVINRTGTSGIVVFRLEDGVDAPVAEMLSPTTEDWDWLHRDYLSTMPETLVTASDSSWTIVWNSEGFAAVGAQAEHVPAVAAVWDAHHARIDAETVTRLLSRLAVLDRGPMFQSVVTHYGGLIRWAFPSPHRLRQMWDGDSLIQRAVHHNP